MDRRKFLTRAGLVSAASVATVACGDKPYVGPVHSKDVSKFGHPIAVEYQKDAAGNWEKTPGVRTAYSRCFTCNNVCGLRVRVDEKTDKVMKVVGNPYCENNSGSPLPLSTSVKDSYIALTGDAGLENRATTCAKGSSAVDSVDDERRITQVLKRAGKRGEGKWETISYEQALKEILEGGDLFGEGHVDGLKALRNLDELIKPGHPEFGSKANQLFATFNAEDTLRGSFYARFMQQSWGTVNLGTKHAYCGAAQATGYALGVAEGFEEWLNDVDWEAVEYGLFLGTSPGSSGVSLNRLGRGLADSRVGRKFKYVCVDPLLRTTVAADTNAKWLPIKPGKDGAFAFGVIRTMLEEQWFNKVSLQCASPKAAEAAGELHHTNAGHLVVMDPKHPRYRQFAQASEFGLGGDEALILTAGTKKLVSAESGANAELFVSRTLKNKQGHKVNVASSLHLLRKEAQRTSMKHYAEQSGVSIEDMRQVAKDLAHYGRKSCVAGNGGTSASDGFVIGWIWALLNTLAGSHDAKGGAIYMNGGIGGLEGLYDLANIDGGVDVSAQVNACRDGSYESSTEYQQKLAQGKNPYPADNPWHEVLPAMNAAEQWTSHANADPYTAKAFIAWRNNFLYSAGSISQEVLASIADPKRLPLMIGIDCHMNETNRYADYFIPDRSMLEEYAADRMWGSINLAVVTASPMVTPRTALTKRGEHICMEQFLIDIALKMKLPGFGKDALKTKNGGTADLLCFEDWHARYLANVAEQCGQLPTVTAEDREWAGLDYAMAPIKTRLTADEAAKVEALLSRGGYYEAPETRYTGEFMTGAAPKALQIYHQDVAQMRHPFSGEFYPGTPTYHEHRFWNGDTWEKHWPAAQYPLLFSSYKATVRSNFNVAFTRIAEISPTNYVYLNTETANEQGLKDGDEVKIVSANGKPTQGVVQADSGVAKGAVCVSHGFGHNQGFGGDTRIIDGKTVAAIAARGTGTAVNQMVPDDPTRKGQASMLNDYWTGANCRHGIPVKLVKV
ncbi:molybdopterin dinucleotide binding domain-containing protein [Shewanella intestini]|uniref:Tetrathionate reductase subunit TtrA n=1 Tax=Shewanella intestini TaxID=2017544 RepID=A0ABS5I2A6_9GAMM|nr:MULTISPECIES: molybdopterin dinucleotide binding domain-containing protein [Shewanella]MBR9728164.1 tetrathionate reductase subunit TtrA [Shewanella intestini]MRG36635.1 tetrathionate reductase subunit TtrA [Shewanella sp. XMDDZSB0408]